MLLICTLIILYENTYLISLKTDLRRSLRLWADNDEKAGGGNGLKMGVAHGKQLLKWVTSPLLCYLLIFGV